MIFFVLSPVRNAIALEYARRRRSSLQYFLSVTRCLHVKCLSPDLREFLQPLKFG
jgi:hypothetical protein